MVTTKSYIRLRPQRLRPRDTSYDSIGLINLCFLSDDLLYYIDWYLIIQLKM